MYTVQWIVKCVHYMWKVLCSKIQIIAIHTVKFSKVQCSVIQWSVEGSLLLIASQPTAPATGASQSDSFWDLFLDSFMKTWEAGSHCFKFHDSTDITICLYLERTHPLLWLWLYNLHCTALSCNNLHCTGPSKSWIFWAAKTLLFGILRNITLKKTPIVT